MQQEFKVEIAGSYEGVNVVYVVTKALQRELYKGAGISSAKPPTRADGDNMAQQLAQAALKTNPNAFPMPPVGEILSMTVHVNNLTMGTVIFRGLLRVEGVPHKEKTVVFCSQEDMERQERMLRSFLACDGQNRRHTK